MQDPNRILLCKNSKSSEAIYSLPGQLVQIFYEKMAIAVLNIYAIHSEK
jgi:hypothetical protein